MIEINNELVNTILIQLRSCVINIQRIPKFELYEPKEASVDADHMVITKKEYNVWRARKMKLSLWHAFLPLLVPCQGIHALYSYGFHSVSAQCAEKI